MLFRVCFYVKLIEKNLISKITRPLFQICEQNEAAAPSSSGAVSNDGAKIQGGGFAFKWQASARLVFRYRILHASVVACLCIFWCAIALHSMLHFLAALRTRYMLYHPNGRCFLARVKSYV